MDLIASRRKSTRSGEANAEIFLASVENGGEHWSTPTVVSSSPRNDWDPQLAAAPDGTVYVAWDTYDRRNYDVLLRPVKDGKPGAIIPVADTCAAASA